ncbi:MAG: ABC transporter substrate-binding protein [Chromatiaceae bacterium]|nr:MAG: ABC transporter substrate-binding protein [Chromatiaceae bacterium]
MLKPHPQSLLTLLAALVLAEPAPAGEVAFTDHEGRAVSLPRPARRVASLPIPMASTLVALEGSPDILVGMHPLAKSAMAEGILGRIFPQVGGIPSDITAAGFVPNVEALAVTAPDLVIQWGERGGDIVDPITNAGMTVMLIRYGVEQNAREYMTMAARAIGRADRIEPLVTWRAAVEAEMRAVSDTIPEADRPSVLYLGRALENLTASGSENNYNAWYMDLAGGRNAAHDLVGQGVTISPEQIATWDPDVILLNSFEPHLTTARIFDDPILSLTTAAQAGRVYKMPLGGYRWDPPNQESPLTWMWLAMLLHPDRFDYDLRAEMRAAYRTLYDHELSDADIDEILWMDMQGVAPGYARFAAAP